MQAQLWNLMLCLNKSTIWPQKLVAEVLSSDVNQNPIDLLPMHAAYMNHALTSCFEQKDDKSYRCTVLFWTSELDALCAKKILHPNINESRVYIVCSYHVISNFIVLVIIGHSLKQFWQLAFSWCFAHLGSYFLHTFSCSCCVYNGRKSWGDFF